MANGEVEMQSFNARLHTFHSAHQLGKRRASTQASSKKKGANTIEWPHKQPSADDLARAGFFYRPASESPDNVQCFYCSVKLDGWEPSDNPLKEHLAHSAGCHWARSVLAGAEAQEAHDAVAQNPMDEEVAAARRGTFELGAAWPHENKRGWKCKISKMVEAGWCFDPAPTSEDEESDGVTCFYCNLSLDGWEPKDDPFVEHKKRNPDCAFFALVEKAGSNDTVPQKGKGKGRGKAGARNSTATKGTRLSTQSVQSILSEAPSLLDVDVSEQLVVDDSIVSTASQATITGATNSKKKAAKPKPAAKGAKGRKRANTMDSEVEAPALYPDLSSQVEAQPIEEQPASQADPAAAPPKKTRKGTRTPKQPLDSSIIEISSFDIAPAKKPTRGRKAKAQPEPEVEATQEAEAEVDNSHVSAQLQEELERSMTMDAQIDDFAPELEPIQEKRGVKRTSAGLKKSQDSDTGGAALEDFPAPPKTGPAAKAKRTRKPSKQAVEAVESSQRRETEDDLPMSESEIETTEPAKTKKNAAKKATQARKASSTRSSRSSKATITADSEGMQQYEPEDLERDEREIEAELERIAAEQAMEIEQEKAAEFEASPSRAVKQNTQMRQLEKELEAEAIPKPSPAAMRVQKNAAPSPAGSDKENQPTSTHQPTSKHLQPLSPILSPTKTTRIPLAPGTPNRSPSKFKTLLSPSKQISHLTSRQPWEAIDLDSILLASPQPTPGTLAQRLAGVTGALTTPEKDLTVEEWVRFQADKGEEELRRRCEEMVGVFEREGMKGLRCLEGISAVE